MNARLVWKMPWDSATRTKHLLWVSNQSSLIKVASMVWEITRKIWWKSCLNKATNITQIRKEISRPSKRNWSAKSSLRMWGMLSKLAYTHSYRKVIWQARSNTSNRHTTTWRWTQEMPTPLFQNKAWMSEEKMLISFVSRCLSISSSCKTTIASWSTFDLTSTSTRTVSNKSIQTSFPQTRFHWRTPNSSSKNWDGDRTGTISSRKCLKPNRSSSTTARTSTTSREQSPRNPGKSSPKFNGWATSKPSNTMEDITISTACSRFSRGRRSCPWSWTATRRRKKTRSSRYTRSFRLTWRRSCCWRKRRW